MGYALCQELMINRQAAKKITEGESLCKLFFQAMEMQ